MKEQTATLSYDPNAPGSRRPFLKALHHLLLRHVRVDVKRPFADALVTNSGRLLARRLEQSRHKNLLEKEDLTDHYGDMPVGEEGLSNVLRSFILGRLALIDDVLDPKEIERSTFLDVGDSDGIFIRALQKRGTSLNGSDKVVRNIAEKGLRAVRGDATRLPLQDDVYDYVLCFETLEHLPNPLGGLMELHRVCRKGAIISVPYVHATTVYPSKFRDIPQDLLHIFELSPDHWTALISHTPFKIAKTAVIPVLERPRWFKEQLAFGIWERLFGKDIFHSTFTKFLAFHLIKPRG